MSGQRYAQDIAGRPVGIAGSVKRATTSINAMLLDDLERSKLDELLRAIATRVCRAHGIDFAGMPAVTRVFMTHYRCTMCGVRPSYFISLKSLKRVRCGICGYSVPFRNSSKYGRIRKEISIVLNNSLRVQCETRLTIISP